METLRALDSDVERAVAVDVGTKLAVLLGECGRYEQGGCDEQ